MTARKPTSPAEAWKAAIEQASDTDMLAASLATHGPVQLAPGDVIGAAKYTVSRAIADDGTVLLNAVDADGHAVHPDPAVRNPVTGEPLAPGEVVNPLTGKPLAPGEVVAGLGNGEPDGESAWHDRAAATT